MQRIITRGGASYTLARDYSFVIPWTPFASPSASLSARRNPTDIIYRRKVTVNIRFRRDSAITRRFSIYNAGKQELKIIRR